MSDGTKNRRNRVAFGGLVHIPVLQSEGLEVVAVCARRQERAASAAKQFGIPRAFSDYASMMRLPGLDAVSIVTPVELHHEMSLAALKAGKHVICEKPLAMDAAQAHEMWLLARDSGLTAMVAYEFRFAPAVVGVKKLLDSGYVGKLRICLLNLIVAGPRSTRTVPASPSEGGEEGTGLLVEIGSQYIDCLRYWFGEVTSVSGEVSAFRSVQDGPRRAVPGAEDDIFFFTLHFEDGGIANKVASVAAPFGTGASIEIYGTEGTLLSPVQQLNWRALSPRGRNPSVGGKVMAARIAEERLQELEFPSRNLSEKRSASASVSAARAGVPA